MFRELRAKGRPEHENAASTPTPKTPRQAMLQIIAADVSMSLDNVLAVAGAARDHEVVLWFGLALSVVLMAVAANFIARILDRYHWVAWIGFAIILYVAGDMIWDGSQRGCCRDAEGVSTRPMADELWRHPGARAPCHAAVDRAAAACMPNPRRRAGARSSATATASSIPPRSAG